MSIVTEYTQWLDNNQDVTKEEYTDKQKEAENKLLPIIKLGYEKSNGSVQPEPEQEQRVDPSVESVD